MNELTNYYAKRAQEYDKIYLKPERQHDLTYLKNKLSNAFNNSNVLEIAAGTGYWTQYISRTAISILATDYNQEVIKIAKTRSYNKCNVEFLLSDAYLLDNIVDKYSAGFSGFWWSHILKSDIDEFLKSFNSYLLPASKVVFLDNRYIKGSSTPISRFDESNNSYQIRQLEDGSTYEVLKNFPSIDEIKHSLKVYGTDIEVELLDYYWFATYKTI